MSDTVNMMAALGGEDVVYVPHNGTARTFTALIERRPSQVETVAGVAYTVNSIQVWIPRDATNGVLAVQDKGKDRIRFKKRLADADVTEFTVDKLLNEDAGMLASDGGMFQIEVKA